MNVDHISIGVVLSGVIGTMAGLLTVFADHVEPTQVTVVSAMLVVCGLIARLWLQDRGMSDGVEVRLRQSLVDKETETNRLKAHNDEVLVELNEKLITSREAAAFMRGRCTCGAVNEWRKQNGPLFPDEEENA